MRCQDVMTQNPMVCSVTDSVTYAARLMKAGQVGPIPVVGDMSRMRLVGIITDRDIVRKVIAEGLDPEETEIGDVMTRDLVTCHPEDDVEDALGAMADNRVRRILVVDDGGRLRGIISQADIATRMDKTKKAGEVVREISRPGLEV